MPDETVRPSSRLKLRRNARRRLAATLICVGPVAAAATACGGRDAPTRVTLPPGATFSQVTDSLAAHRVIGNRPFFKLLARIKGVDRSARAGVYEFPANSSSWTVLDMLAAGQTLTLRVTVPEGLTIYELAALAEERAAIPAVSLEAAAMDGAAATASLGFPAPSFEGFLQPETYSLAPGTGGRELVRLMAEEFKQGWSPVWTARLDSIGMSQLELVTFASIVEGEARADDERETIAGVYRNRLRIGMALQADPTVQYAIALQTGRRKPRLYEKDYQIDSPYNTYLHPGLPPGPVNSPSQRSIEAALYPATVPYLYFVAGPDGRHIFSRNYDEHLRAVARVRRIAANGGH
jgi:UPF0755 protein